MPNTDSQMGRREATSFFFGEALVLQQFQKFISVHYLGALRIPQAPTAQFRRGDEGVTRFRQIEKLHAHAKVTDIS